jgi:hypothetical protein
MTQWWYNHKTGQAEEGPQSLGVDRDGPFENLEQAEHAPQIIAERARKWAEDEGSDDANDEKMR